MIGGRRLAARTTRAAATEPDPGRDALLFLAGQGLPPTPQNYALAWQIGAERHGLVAMAVDAILMDGRTVLPADVQRIMAARPPAKAANAEADPQHTELRHQTLRLAQLAAGAADSSSTFGRDLAEGLHHLAGGSSPLQEMVEAMVGRTRAVEAELRSASREIETLREQVDAVRDDAHRDVLTGLLNRRGAMHELNARAAGGVGVVAICDVDHFKSINDRFGHNVGDRVLKGVAATLSEGCEVHQVARWGGEEFLVILDGIGMEQAGTLLDRVRQRLGARAFRVRETDELLGRVTMSIGLAPLQQKGIEDAIELADRRLYAAKRAGRDRLVAGD